jgi:hypothetical protein
VTAVRRLAVLCLVALPQVAAARVHVGLGVGGLVEATAPTGGAWAGLEVWPVRRWGGRLDARLQGDRVLLEASVATELGAARPHLAITLHLGGGVVFENDQVRPVFTIGIATLFGLHKVAPLAIALDVSAHLYASRELDLTAVLGLAAWF